MKNMKQTIYDTLRKISGFFQSSTGSFKRHNDQYTENGKLEMERTSGLKHLADDSINNPEMRTKDLLQQHPQIKIAIDVGSGTGWSSAALANITETVIGIEPSQAAVDISKTIYPANTYPNITWIQGFAEEILPTLKIESPTLFLTGCVLSHIRDKEVTKICQAISAAAPIGSVMSLAECFGDEPWHQLMWHVRTKDWWQEQFPEWELTFHGPQVPNERYFKGIWGVKKGNA
jgi:SAM-dependent methyltransferase